MMSLAVQEQSSRGREFSEEDHPYRSAFERDRDRIIHCAAFRRLEGKTQVFTTGLDDYYRTRLTHSIEVAQIGRTIARALGLNEPLTEAICLAHDLGHPPFGHSGEKVLNTLLAGHGGYEHNKQTVRIVTLLEHPYPDFMGLNLMYETRLALAKHRSTYDHPASGAFDAANCSLEGQIADLADRIAYNCHDLEDGQKARLIDADQLERVSIFTEAERAVGAQHLADRTLRRTRTSKAMIDRLVSDCIQTSRETIAAAGVERVEEVLKMAESLIRLSPQSHRALRKLEAFLMKHFYLHPSLRETADKVHEWLGTLFDAMCGDPALMPGYFQDFISRHGVQRAVADYIAGMTDRFCLKRFESL
ncbi:MAG: dNTP triphosphohydrolase [Planctomycetes bacterium]|nr:dNTP triphosphohydrolase [Planctomycetota bacterium]